jgi:uncharacterized protein
VTTHPRRVRAASLLAALSGWIACVLASGTAHAAPTPFPTPVGFVNDFARVIDPATKASLEARIDELKQKTGSEIAVVTVPSVKPETPFDYAMHIAEAWKPGAPGKDNGVVFLVAVEDRGLFIVTGYGIGGALPDGLVGEIRDREIVPRFKAGDMAGGIRAGVERMAAIIAHEYNVTLSGTPPPPLRRQQPAAGLPISPLLLLVLLVLFFIVLPSLTSSAGVAGRRRGPYIGPTMWGGGFGGGGFGGSGGGFGGFGGGSFGGGGAGGSW